MRRANLIWQIIGATPPRPPARNAMDGGGTIPRGFSPASASAAPGAGGGGPITTRPVGADEGLLARKAHCGRRFLVGGGAAGFGVISLVANRPWSFEIFFRRSRHGARAFQGPSTAKAPPPPENPPPSRAVFPGCGILRRRRKTFSGLGCMRNQRKAGNGPSRRRGETARACAGVARIGRRAPAICLQPVSVRPPRFWRAEALPAPRRSCMPSAARTAAAEKHLWRGA